MQQNKHWKNRESNVIIIDGLLVYMPQNNYI